MESLLERSQTKLNGNGGSSIARLFCSSWAAHLDSLKVPQWLWDKDVQPVVVPCVYGRPQIDSPK